MLKIYKILLSTVICVSYGNTMNTSNYYLGEKKCYILQNKRSIENVFQNSLNDSLEGSLKGNNIIHTENNSHDRAPNTFDSSQYMHVYKKNRISKTLDKNNKRRQCNVIKNIYNKESLKASSNDTLLYNHYNQVIPTAFNVIPFDVNKPILLMPTNNSLMQNLTHNNRKDIKTEDNIINNNMNINNIEKFLDNRTRTINNESNKQDAMHISKQEFMNIVQQQFKNKDDDNKSINTNNNDNLINNILTKNDIQTSGKIRNRPKMNNIYLKTYRNINSKSVIIKQNKNNAILNFNNKPIIINDNNNQNESNNNFAYYDNRIITNQNNVQEKLKKSIIEKFYKDNKNMQENNSLNDQILINNVNNVNKVNNLLPNLLKTLQSDKSNMDINLLVNTLQTVVNTLQNQSVASNDNIEEDKKEAINLKKNSIEDKKIKNFFNNTEDHQKQTKVNIVNKNNTNIPLQNLFNKSSFKNNKYNLINNNKLKTVFNMNAKNIFGNILNNVSTNNNLRPLSNHNNDLQTLPNTNQVQNTNGFKIVKNEQFSINKASIKNPINNNIILSINKENDVCINKKPKQTKDVETQINIIQEQVTTVTTTTYTKKCDN